MITLSIRKESTDPTLYQLQPGKLLLGAQNSNLLDDLYFSLPSEWSNYTVRATFIATGGQRIAFILPENGILTVTEAITRWPCGTLLLDACNEKGIHAYTNEVEWLVATHSTAGGSSPTPHPDEWLQLVQQVQQCSAAATAAATDIASRIEQFKNTPAFIAGSNIEIGVDGRTISVIGGDGVLGQMQAEIDHAVESLTQKATTSDMSHLSESIIEVQKNGTDFFSKDFDVVASGNGVTFNIVLFAGNTYTITNKNGYYISAVYIEGHSDKSVALGANKTIDFVPSYSGKLKVYDIDRINVGTRVSINVKSDVGQKVSNLMSATENIENTQEDIKKQINESTDYNNLSWIDGYWNASGYLVKDASSGFVYEDTPIFIPKGATITYYAKGYSTNVCMIGEVKSNSTSLTPLVVSNDSTAKEYTYTATRDMYVKCSGSKSAERKIRVSKSTKYTLSLIEDIVGTDIDYINIFHKVGVIGDSLSSGEIAYVDADGEHYIDRYDYSWLSNICKTTNAVASHYSRGGMTTKQWLSDQKKTEFDADTPCAAYFVALGTNDKWESYPLGTVSDVAGTDSFVGYYKQIINAVIEKAPNAVVFTVSLYSKEASSVPYSNMIESVSKQYENVYYVDFINNTQITTGDGNTAFTNQGHFTTTGYVVVANTIRKICNKLIAQNNDKDFFRFFALNNN